ncbi:MAG: tetratricopeptide repeat protein, partial [Synergistota bacterium]|nr:tetratricopeptide repeat protein [Synergistota bacterium]
PRELVEIALFMASRENLDISDEAAFLLMRHMEGRIGAPGFSNAREVRNIMDHAKTAMSLRLRGRRKVIGWDMKVVTSVDMEEALGKGQDVAAAIEESRRAMYSDPSDPIMRLRLAEAYAEAGLWSDAVTTLEPMQASLDPEGAAMLGRALYVTGEYQKAKPMLSRAGEIPDTRFFYGLSLLWGGEFDEAAETLETALKDAPDAPERRLALAAARVLAKQWEKAAKSFTEALDVSEGRLPASVVRELPLETLPGEGASECLKQAMNLAWLDSTRAMLRFAEALEYTGDETASLAVEGMLKNVLKREPDNAGAHRIIASMAARKGRNEQAVISLEIALDLEPRRTEDWVLLADLYRKTGNEEKAREIFVEVLDDSGSGKVALELAIVAEKENREADAVGLYEKAWAAGLEGEDAMLCARRLGSIRASAGRFPEALRIFESAPGVETDAGVAFWKARCFVEAGKWAEAEPLLAGIAPEGNLGEAFSYWRLRLLVVSKDLFRARGNLTGRAVSPYLALAEAAVRAFSGEPSARSALDGVSTAEMGCDALSLYALARAATKDWAAARLAAGRASTASMGPLVWERQSKRPAEESHYLEAVCQAHLGEWVSALDLFRRASGALSHPAALFGQGVALVALSEVESAWSVLSQLRPASEAAARKLELLIQSNSGIRKILADPVDPGLLDPFVFQ